jgi:hypothetical protein
MLIFQATMDDWDHKWRRNPVNNGNRPLKRGIEECSGTALEEPCQSCLSGCWGQNLLFLGLSARQTTHANPSTKGFLRSQMVKGRQSKGTWKHKCDWNKLSDTLSANRDPHLLLHYCSYKDAPPTTLLGGTEEKYQWQPDCGAAQTPGVSIWEACRKPSWWRLHGGQLWHPAPF